MSWKAQKDGLTCPKHSNLFETGEKKWELGLKQGMQHSGDSGEKGDVEHTKESLEITNKKAQKTEWNRKCICVKKLLRQWQLENGSVEKPGAMQYLVIFPLLVDPMGQ